MSLSSQTPADPLLERRHIWLAGLFVWAAFHLFAPLRSLKAAEPTAPQWAGAPAPQTLPPAATGGRVTPAGATASAATRTY